MSSTIFNQGYKFLRSSYRLDTVPEKLKLLTVKFPLQTLAEFAAAAEFSRERSVSALVHQFVIKTIEETQEKVEPSRFKDVYLKKLAEIEERSRKKSLERKRAQRIKKKVIISNKRQQTG